MKKNTNDNTDELLQLVSFKLGDEEFGIDILNVHEIIRIVKITSVPNSPNFIEGVIDLRDRVIPILDLRIKLNMAKKEYGVLTRIIVTEIKGVSVGFIVDSVNEVLRIPKSISEPPPPIIGGDNADFITSVCKLENRLITLLDFNKVLTGTNIEEMKTVN